MSIEKIILCTNNETLMQGYEDIDQIDECGDTVSDLGCELLQKAFGDFETDSQFKNWHGYRGPAKEFGNIKVYGDPSDDEADRFWSINSAMKSKAQELADEIRSMPCEDE